VAIVPQRSCDCSLEWNFQGETTPLRANFFPNDFFGQSMNLL